MLLGLLRSFFFLVAVTLATPSWAVSASLDPCAQLLSGNQTAAISSSRDIRWNTLPPPVLLKKIQADFETFKIDFDRIVHSKEAPTFENTLLAIDIASNKLGNSMSMYSWLNEALKTPEIEAIQAPVNAVMTQYQALVIQSEPYLKRVELIRPQLKPGSEEAIITESAYKNLMQSGARFSDEKKARLTSIHERLANLGNDFENNIQSMKTDPAALRTANEKVVLETIELRGQLAKELGFESYADLVLEDRMAGSPERLRKFYQDLMPEIKRLAANEKRAITRFQNTHPELGLDAAVAGLKNKLYHVDDNQFLPYFELGNTVRGTFDFLEEMFEIKIVRLQDVKSFSPEVMVFQVLDANTQKVISELHLDLFSRATKRQGAWMATLRAGGLGANGNEFPIVGVFLNMKVPPAGKGVLLRPAQVKVLLHELGHALHESFSTLKYKEFAGARVKRDFVEFPSQIMENWLTTPEFLAKVSKHYATKEPMPIELAEQFKKSEGFLAGNAAERQMQLGIIDFSWHELSDPHFSENCDFVCDFERKSLKEFSIRTDKDYTPVSPHFMHVFGGGYAMGYYGYLWAKMIEQDGFEYWHQDPASIHEKAMRLRNEILSQGGLTDPNELYRKWRGHDFSSEAYLKSIGL
jgi:Zn-dependent oligopeptidase